MQKSFFVGSVMLRIPSDTPNTPAAQLQAKLSALAAYVASLEAAVNADEAKLMAKFDELHELGNKALAAHAANPNADAKASEELSAYLKELHRLGWVALEAHKKERAKLRLFREAHAEVLPLLYAEARAAESKGGANE